MTLVDAEDILAQYSNYVRKYKFKDAWLLEGRFSSWLKKSENGGAFCVNCQQSITAEEAHLLRHAGTKKHKKLSTPNEIEDIDPMDYDVAVGKLKIAALVVDRNLSFMSCNHLIPVFKFTAKDSEIMKNLYLDRHGVKRIIENVLAPAHRNRLRKILKTEKFSVIVDEATDVSVVHSLCIIVRYFDEEYGIIREDLWDLVEVYTKQDSLASAENISNLIMDSFRNEKIPFDNIVSFCSDTCSLMMGVFTGVAARLKSEIKHLLVLHCNAHIQHLSAKNSMKKIPIDIEGFLTEISHYINHSGKRHNRWILYQRGKGLDALEILRPANTRWLSTGQCIERILRRWTALNGFVRDENKYKSRRETVKKLTKIKKITNYLEHPLLKYYLRFLYLVLSEFNFTNATMQSISPQFEQNSDLMTILFKKLASMYMDETYVRNSHVDFINPLSGEKNLPINRLNIGGLAEEIWEDTSIPADLKTSFLSSCKSFIRNTCNELKSKVWEKENDSTLYRSMFHPNNVLSSRFHRQNPDLNVILEIFSKFVDQNLANSINMEWAEIYKYTMSESMKNEKNLEVFWDKISKTCDEHDQPIFSNLANFVRLTFLLPNSNASAERIWSKYSLEKTKLRNKLYFQTVRSILFAAQLVRNNGGAAVFEPPNDMVMELLNPKQHPDDPEEAGNSSGVEDPSTEENSRDVEQHTSEDEERMLCQLEDKLYFRSKRTKNSNNGI